MAPIFHPFPFPFYNRDLGSIYGQVPFREYASPFKTHVTVTRLKMLVIHLHWPFLRQMRDTRSLFILMHLKRLILVPESV